MIVFRFLLVGGKSVTIGGERVIRGVFCETFDICPLCSVFLWYAVVWYFCICVICPGKRASPRKSELSCSRASTRDRKIACRILNHHLPVLDKTCSFAIPRRSAGTG
mgnify:CR=1 FL=1